MVAKETDLCTKGTDKAIVSLLVEQISLLKEQISRYWMHSA